MDKVYEKSSKAIRFILSLDKCDEVSYEGNKIMSLTQIELDGVNSNTSSYVYEHCYDFSMGKLTITLGRIKDRKEYGSDADIKPYSYKMVVRISQDDPTNFGLNNRSSKYIFTDVEKLFNEVHNKLDGLSEYSSSSIEECLDTFSEYPKWNRDYKINEVIK